VLNVSDDNAYVKVSGAVGDIEKAFHTQIGNVTLNGQSYFANTSDPKINDASGAHVDAISGMDNYDFTPDLAYPNTGEGAQAQRIPLNAGANGALFEGQRCRSPTAQTFTGGGARLG
jgi:subtilase family serine protease